VNITRFEARLSKRDEAIALQNKVAAEQTVLTIENKYDPITQDEIDFYKSKLTLDGLPLINPLQMQLIGYMFYKDFGETFKFAA